MEGELKKIMEELWTTVCEVMRDEVPPLSYNTWIKTLIPVSMENHKVILKTKTIFYQQNMQAQENGMIRPLRKMYKDALRH